MSAAAILSRPASDRQRHPVHRMRRAFSMHLAKCATSGGQFRGCHARHLYADARETQRDVAALNYRGDGSKGSVLALTIQFWVHQPGNQRDTVWRKLASRRTRGWWAVTSTTATRRRAPKGFESWPMSVIVRILQNRNPAPARWTTWRRGGHNDSQASRPLRKARVGCRPRRLRALPMCKSPRNGYRRTSCRRGKRADAQNRSSFNGCMVYDIYLCGRTMRKNRCLLGAKDNVDICFFVQFLK